METYRGWGYPSSYPTLFSATPDQARSPIFHRHLSWCTTGMFTVLTPEGNNRVVRKRKAPVDAVQKGAACAECKRRKVACSNSRPCESCIRFKCTEKCVSAKADRIATTEYGQMSSLGQYMSIVEKLFPGTPIENLVSLSTNDLKKHSEFGSMELDALQDREKSESVSGEEILENDWVKEYGWEEDFDKNDRIADDVNGLHMSLKSKSSYLGAPSISAVINVIYKLGKHQFANTIKEENWLDSDGLDIVSADQSSAAVPSFTYTHGLKLIDAYFEYVHPTAPIVHEPVFRRMYSSRQKKRSSWLALLYIVLAWGTIASSEANCTDDIVFYKASRDHLRNLGGGNVEYLQAMILIGGHYLHYRNMPNTAMAMTGAAFKIACGLGLHRELTHKTAQITVAPKEQRRRLWYTLYTMEISGMFTLGRPSMFGGRGITIEPPQNVSDITGTVVDGQLTSVSPLICSVGLSRLLEKVESLYLETQWPSEGEATAHDAELVSWFAHSPPYLRNPMGATMGIYMALCSTKWQYMNARMVLYRTFVLKAALSRKKITELAPKTAECVEKCRSLAYSTISEISSEWRPHPMSCWPGVWYLYQATMIPLVTLFSEDRQDPLIRQACQTSIDQSLRLIDQMSQYRYTGQQSRKVIKVMYEASQKLPDDVTFTPADESTWEEILWAGDDAVEFLQETNFISMLLGAENEQLSQSQQQEPLANTSASSESSV